MIYTEKESVAKWMKDSATLALQVIPASHAGWSKIGGLPDSSTFERWPTWKGRPLSFLAQLDFSEITAVAELPGFPKSGRVFFFYDPEQSTAGFDPNDKGSWQVLFQENLDANTISLKPPKDLTSGLYNETKVSFHSIESLPDVGRRIEIDYQAIGVQALEELSALKSNCYQQHPRHQIGGYPAAIQNDTMELECQLASNGLFCGNESGYNDPRRRELEVSASDWVLLFQLDTDDSVGMMWGDVGTLYFWVRRQDLARLDFSKVWMILQCC